VLITALIIIIRGLADPCAVRLAAVLNRISVWWLLIGLVVIVTALVAVPDHHRPASFVTHFADNTGFTSGPYGGMLGLLVTSWTFTGFGGSFHMSEETVRATVNAPRGITRAIACSAVTGLILILQLRPRRPGRGPARGHPVVVRHGAPPLPGAGQLRPSGRGGGDGFDLTHMPPPPAPVRALLQGPPGHATGRDQYW
jgi:hypothetical protein